MQLITARPLPTPMDAERLVADIWQLSAGRGLGLFTVAFGGRVALAVHSGHEGLEAAVAATIADQCGGSVETGWMVPQLFNAAAEVTAVNLVPTDRRLAVENHTFGWQRSDPLRATFLALDHLPETLLAGVAVTLRALPDLAFLISIGVFAAGPGARAAVGRIASTFGGVGVRVRRPLLQRRAACRMLQATVRRPAEVRRAEVVTLYWHPPYGETWPSRPWGPDPQPQEP